jgi:hypothetical protein
MAFLLAFVLPPPQAVRIRVKRVRNVKNTAPSLNFSGEAGEDTLGVTKNLLNVDEALSDKRQNECCTGTTINNDEGTEQT